MGGGKAFSAETQTKGLKENETSDIFWGFTETNQLRKDVNLPSFIQISPIPIQLFLRI
jgi:hypothetical protein